MTDLVSRLLEAITAQEASAGKESSNTYVRYGKGGTYSGRRHVNVDRRDRVLRRCTADRRTVEEWLKQVENPFNGLSDDPPYFIVNLAEAYGLEVTQ